MPERKPNRKRKKVFLFSFIFIVGPMFLLTSHELSVRHFQDVTCVVCHEMDKPIDNWIKSGTAKNHGNCASCHFDAGFKGWMDMNKSAMRFGLAHFSRDKGAPIEPRPEPLFLEEGMEPGYWSHVPNSRCSQCKKAPNHSPIDQARIHNKLLKDISSQPCKDCHNHEMRNGQKFYEKVTEDPKAGDLVAG